jgi:hypothetical protein
MTDPLWDFTVRDLGPLPPGKTLNVHQLRESRGGQSILRQLGKMTDEQIEQRMTSKRLRANTPEARAVQAAYSKSPEGKETAKRYRQAHSKTYSGAFLGWDGEGADINGRHRYILLANGYGDHISETMGLTTEQCLTFLHASAMHYSFTNHVMFGGNYDANMILADLSWEEMTKLSQRGWLEWRGWEVKYRHHKYLEIAKMGPRVKKGAEEKRSYKGRIKVWDVIDFFGMKFTSSLKVWLPEEDITFIAEMKNERGTFRPDDLPRITQYCISECVLLGRMMEELRKQCKSVDSVPEGWYGPGALATVGLKKHKVRDYMDRELANGTGPISTASRHAFFGGRIEMVQYGHYGHKSGERIYGHDIVSAYPSVMEELPCLAHGEWIHDYRIRTGQVVPPFTLVRVDHKPFRDDIRGIHPLPWRHPTGGVLFPLEANGWYWMPEAQLVPSSEWVESWSFVPGCDHKPFDWVPTMFGKRQAMKANGHPAQLVLKLLLNSLYGKMAQRIGGKIGVAPSFHQLEWAGFITSSVRAKMYRLVAQPGADCIPNWDRMESVIAFETDGVYATGELVSNDPSGSLGSWEVTPYDEIAYVHSGVYFLRSGERWISRYRGLDPPRVTEDGTQIGLTPERVLESWATRTWTLPATTKRFRGLATSSLTPERFNDWGQWITEPRDVDLIPTGKRASQDDRGNPTTELCPTIAIGSGAEMSTRHKLSWIDGPTADSWRQEEELDWEVEHAS